MAYPELLMVALDFATAMLLGALVGIEREKRKSEEEETHHIAGLRTFILLALFGAAAGFISRSLSAPWILGVSLLIVGAYVVAGYYATSRTSQNGKGKRESGLDNPEPTPYLNKHHVPRPTWKQSLIGYCSKKGPGGRFMQLIEMRTSGGHVQMLYANAATKDEASEWLEFRVHSPTRANQRLGAMQQQALHRVRELIDAENERFAAFSAQVLE